MKEGNISQEFRSNDIDETRSYFVEEINQDELMSKKHRKVCRALNYICSYLFLFLQLLDVFPFLRLV